LALLDGSSGKSRAVRFPASGPIAQGKATATRFLAERWMEVAPRGLFDTLAGEWNLGRSSASHELARVLFREWPRRDPEAVIAALNEPQALGLRKKWGAMVVESLIENNAERGLRLMAEWRIEDFIPRMTGIAKWAAADPRHAAEFAFENSVGYASRYTLETIGKEWAKTEPTRAIEFALEKPGELGLALADAALREWAIRDHDQAASWLAEVDARTRNRLSSAFVEVWAKQDAAGALTWSQEHLIGSSLTQAIGEC
jgi:hypothetical protein